MKRSFWSLVAVQIQVLLNDNAAKLMLITLGAAVATDFFPRHPAMAEYFAKMSKTIMAAIILLPFILFAPAAGWVSDRFSKRNVIVTSLWAQFAIMALIFWAMEAHNLGLGQLRLVPARHAVRVLLAGQAGASSRRSSR